MMQWLPQGKNRKSGASIIGSKENGEVRTQHGKEEAAVSVLEMRDSQGISQAM